VGEVAPFVFQGSISNLWGCLRLLRAWFHTRRQRLRGAELRGETIDSNPLPTGALSPTDRAYRLRDSRFPGRQGRGEFLLAWHEAHQISPRYLRGDASSTHSPSPSSLRLAGILLDVSLLSACVRSSLCVSLANALWLACTEFLDLLYGPVEVADGPTCFELEALFFIRVELVSFTYKFNCQGFLDSSKSKGHMHGLPAGQSRQTDWEHWYIHSPDHSFPSSSAASNRSMEGFKAGKSRIAVSQTRSVSTSKYPCTRTFRIPAI